MEMIVGNPDLPLTISGHFRLIRFHKPDSKIVQNVSVNLQSEIVTLGFFSYYILWFLP